MTGHIASVKEKTPHRAEFGGGWQSGDRFVDERERQRRTGYSRVSWWRLEKEGRAPKRVKLGARKVAWLLSEIEQWMAARAATRGTADGTVTPPAAAGTARAAKRAARKAAQNAASTAGSDVDATPTAA